MTEEEINTIIKKIDGEKKPQKIAYPKLSEIQLPILHEPPEIPPMPEIDWQELEKTIECQNEKKGELLNIQLELARMDLEKTKQQNLPDLDLKAEIESLKAENEKLKADSPTKSCLNTIAVLLEILLQNDKEAKKNFTSQNDIIVFIEGKYKNITGLNETGLKHTFAKSNRSFKDENK